MRFGDDGGGDWSRILSWGQRGRSGRQAGRVRWCARHCYQASLGFALPVDGIGPRSAEEGGLGRAGCGTP